MTGIDLYNQTELTPFGRRFADWMNDQKADELDGLPADAARVWAHDVDPAHEGTAVEFFTTYPHMTAQLVSAWIASLPADDPDRAVYQLTQAEKDAPADPLTADQIVAAMTAAARLDAKYGTAGSEYGFTARLAKALDAAGYDAAAAAAAAESAGALASAGLPFHEAELIRLVSRFEPRRPRADHEAELIRMASAAQARRAR